jgi:CTP:molybdopterin cytidylyltransferase MocA
MTVRVLLLAAGQSARMRGADKLLMEVDGQPCVRILALRARAAGLPVRVTVPALDHPRAMALIDLDVELVAVPDAALGMGHSIAAGVASLPRDTSAVMIVPADMPDLRRSDFAALAQAHTEHPKAVLRARAANGQNGHPVVFPADLFDDLLHLSGDRGAASVVQAQQGRCIYVDLPGQRATTDLDTPEDWANWQKSQQP